MTQWPFELPSRPVGFLTLENVESYRDACIAAALRWAAEQCELEASKLAFVPTKGVAIDCRDRILAALPKDEANAS